MLVAYPIVLLPEGEVEVAAAPFAAGIGKFHQLLRGPLHVRFARELAVGDRRHLDIGRRAEKVLRVRLWHAALSGIAGSTSTCANCLMPHKSPSSISTP